MLDPAIHIYNWLLSFGIVFAVTGNPQSAVGIATGVSSGTFFLVTLASIFTKNEKF